VLLLQQAIFPSSDVHQNETIVSAWPTQLRHAYEGMGGDVRLEDTRQVELIQTRAFAEAFASGNAVHLDLGVDGILARGRRNAWLRDMRIVLNTDYSQFADAIRASQAETGQQVTDLMAQWRVRGRGFDDVLEIELGSYMSSRMEALLEHAKRYIAALKADDLMAQLNLDMSPIVREMATLRGIFEKAGTPPEELDTEIRRFWEWPENRSQPFARIHAYLFAALAGQVKAGRKKPASPGFMNDVTVIASYAPYVDAMFVDNECATMLSQGRPRDELTYRARIFSLNSKEAFLEYLSEVAAGATEEVRRYAKAIYGA
jgi:hypothetical protein